MARKTLHIILIGPAQAGKSLYLNRVKALDSSGPYEPTIGARLEILDRKINGEVRSLHLWEISDSLPRDPVTRQTIIDTHIKHTDMVLVFFDMNDLYGLNKIAMRFTPALLKAKCTNPHVKFMLIGTQTKPALATVINDIQTGDFFDRHQFNHFSTITFIPVIETQLSFKRCLQISNDAQIDALINQIDAYRYQRRSQTLKSLIAYIAWWLGLSHFLGHYKEDEKLHAAEALSAALSGIYHHLERLTIREKGALREGTLGQLFAKCPNQAVLAAKLTTPPVHPPTTRKA